MNVQRHASCTGEGGGGEGGEGGRGRSRGDWGTPLKIFKRVESVKMIFFKFKIAFV